VFELEKKKGGESSRVYLREICLGAEGVKESAEEKVLMRPRVDERE